MKRTDEKGSHDRVFMQITLKNHFSYNIETCICRMFKLHLWIGHSQIKSLKMT
jgi:hypothetical protein